MSIEYIRKIDMANKKLKIYTLSFRMPFPRAGLFTYDTVRSYIEIPT